MQEIGIGSDDSDGNNIRNAQCHCVVFSFLKYEISHYLLATYLLSIEWLRTYLLQMRALFITYLESF